MLRHYRTAATGVGGYYIIIMRSTTVAYLQSIHNKSETFRRLNKILFIFNMPTMLAWILIDCW